jgi:hypothetical protein
MVDGYIKFKCNWIKSDPLLSEKIHELNKWRKILFNRGLIGSSDGIGYGNLSIRANKFIITGSQTGLLSELNENHYTEVTDYNFKENSLTCKGPIKASSESLTHAAVYESTDFNSVIHIHNLDLWNKLIDKYPTTHAEYGTPALAYEIMKLKSNLIVMGGHKAGIITCRKDVKEAAESILRML